MFSPLWDSWPRVQWQVILQMYALVLEETAKLFQNGFIILHSHHQPKRDPVFLYLLQKLLLWLFYFRYSIIKSVMSLSSVNLHFPCYKWHWKYFYVVLLYAFPFWWNIHLCFCTHFSHWFIFILLNSKSSLYSTFTEHMAFKYFPLICNLSFYSHNKSSHYDVQFMNLSFLWSMLLCHI